MKSGKYKDKLIIRFKGGLGNQMFQYAMYCKQKHLGKQVCADVSAYTEREECMPFVLCDVFPQISLQLVKDEEAAYYLAAQNKKNILDKVIAAFWWQERDYTSEKENGVFDKRVFSLKKGFLDGYWQTEKYFSDIREEVLKDFQFKVADSSLKKYADKIRDNSVSVHVRRGDYLNFPDIYGGICGMDYYKKAMDFFCEKNPETVFYVFSDDKEWIQKAFREYNAVVVEKDFFSDYEDWYDMYLMSQCNHNIIANSSFSWWGAWLNQMKNKKVISPGKWFNGEKTSDIWCPEWIRM